MGRVLYIGEILNLGNMAKSKKDNNKQNIDIMNITLEGNLKLENKNTFSEKQNEELKIIKTDDTIMELSNTDNSDVEAVIETYDIDFGEESIFNAVRLWGAGNIKLSAYARRGTTADIEVEIELNKSGTDVYLNLQGRELRIKIEPIDSENFFMSKSPEVIYANNGVKRMAEVKG